MKLKSGKTSFMRWLRPDGSGEIPMSIAPILRALGSKTDFSDDWARHIFLLVRNWISRKVDFLSFEIIKSDDSDLCPSTFRNEEEGSTTDLLMKAFGEIYKIYMLSHRSDLNISEHFRQTFSHFFAKFCKNSLFLNSFHWFLLRFWWNFVGISPISQKHPRCFRLYYGDTTQRALRVKFLCHFMFGAMFGLLKISKTVSKFRSKRIKRFSKTYWKYIGRPIFTPP